MRTDGALIHYKRVGHRSSPQRYKRPHERLRATYHQNYCFNCRAAVTPAKCPKRSIRCPLAQDASDLLVASHADKGIERLLENVVTTTLAIDQTPTLQPIELADDCSAGHAHIGGNLGDRPEPAVISVVVNGAG